MGVYLFAVRDLRGQEVRLTENCYRLHIFLEHPELVDVNFIADTITTVGIEAYPHPMLRLRKCPSQRRST